MHIYPQGGEYTDPGQPESVDDKTQALRNRSTRMLWDPAYVEEAKIKKPTMYIPRLKKWIEAEFPGLALGITEYSWGADRHISGATAQADILGILGREGVAMAMRWDAPPIGSPVYHAIKMYRNYDGKGGSFGETSVRATAPDCDRLAAFAAQRADGALTVMVINKVAAPETVRLRLTGAPLGRAEAWQLTSANAIAKVADPTLANGLAVINTPGQSITLVVLR
jgi:hypothetical protein